MNYHPAFILVFPKDKSLTRRKISLRNEFSIEDFTHKI